MYIILFNCEFNHSAFYRSDFIFDCFAVCGLFFLFSLNFWNIFFKVFVCDFIRWLLFWWSIIFWAWNWLILGIFNVIIIVFDIHVHESKKGTCSHWWRRLGFLLWSFLLNLWPSWIIWDFRYFILLLTNIQIYIFLWILFIHNNIFFLFCLLTHHSHI